MVFCDKPADASETTVSGPVFIRRIVAGVILVNLFVIALICYSLHESRAQQVKIAEITTQNLSLVLEQNIGNSITKLDLILLATKDELEKHLGDGSIGQQQLDAYLSRQLSRLSELDGLRVADAHGEITYGVDARNDTRIFVGDREYFRMHRETADAGLIISKPIVSRVTGKWSLIISRRVDDKGGSFAGVVYGVISLERYSRLFSSIVVGKNGTITLRGQDMEVLVRYPATSESGNAVGQKVVSATYRDMIEKGLTQGTFKSMHPVDNIERIHSFRKISSYPLYINIGLAAKDYLAEWREEVSRMLAISVFFLSLSVMASVLIYRNWKRRKAAIRALAQQEFKFRTIADFTYDWEFWLGPDGSFIHTSPSCERITGHDAEEFYSAPDLLSTILYPDDRALFSEHRHEAISDGKNGSLVFRILHAEKGVRWIEHVCQPIVDESGNFLGTRGSNRDITERKHAEEERNRLAGQLQQAQKMEAVGQLAGGIAHDFNNILTAIIGYSQIILMRMDKESPLRHYVDQVFASAERAADLTKDLLAFSRKQVLDTRPIDLCQVLEGLGKMLDRLIPEDIDFKISHDEREMIVLADKGQIEQVIMNLVTNARDAMPRGGILSVDISRVCMDERFVHAHGFGEPGEYALISVADSGHGMDAETQRRIFEPFFTTKEVGKGTGLGMAIIYGIIKQHNGYVYVYSEVGKGTTFRIYLPLSCGIQGEAGEEIQSVGAMGGHETILLVEDDGTVRGLHRMILEEAGYSVIDAVDGQDAVDRFMNCETVIDMVVTDVIMPKKDGKRLYKEIEAFRPDMKVLFMSGYTKDIVIERGVLDDELHFVAKPVLPRELLRKVRQILDRKTP